MKNLIDFLFQYGNYFLIGLIILVFCFMIFGMLTNKNYSYENMQVYITTFNDNTYYGTVINSTLRMIELNVFLENTRIKIDHMDIKMIEKSPLIVLDVKDIN